MNLKTLKANDSVIFLYDRRLTGTIPIDAGSDSVIRNYPVLLSHIIATLKSFFSTI
ncbi:hypothetical protein Desac_1955 [Desulfobacca acetoxidans DSM 11109]|uniref:Uncharacterized protein n=1 Tax=Desulfobacca acetoxidans (strain ATCC 700848 / DSM 11109 / ASRB2) TaxID=880072 RepID=F2ND64_DESAR|nr:hypothetical protein Desac_1955 [Desulfobacca acetoxidans DSM 11109]